MKGYLKIFVLKELGTRNLTGYDLIQVIEKITGDKPSPGSIYPLLNDLLDKDFVSFSEEGRKKIYSITAKGKDHIDKLQKEKESAMLKHFEFLKIVETITGDKIKDLEHNHSCDLNDPNCRVVIRNMETWLELKDVIMDLIKNPNFENIERDVVKSLKKCIIELNNINKKMSDN